MKKNGFTLIELLAVIVILAIIALIAVPVILGVIEKAKKGSAKASALGYVDSVEKQILLNEMDSSTSKISDGKYSVINSLMTSDINNTIQYNIKLKGSYPTTGYIIIEKKVVTEYELVFDTYKVKFFNNSVSILKSDVVIVNSNEVTYTNASNPTVDSVDDALNDIYQKINQ